MLTEVAQELGGRPRRMGCKGTTRGVISGRNSELAMNKIIDSNSPLEEPLASRLQDVLDRTALRSSGR